MDSFGTTLKREREERGLTLDTVAAVIGIDLGSLSALERDEFDRLPDHEVMLQGLRAYADCLQVDAELMIQHYEQERELCLQRLADAVAARALETVVEESRHREAERAAEAERENVEVPPRQAYPTRQGPRPGAVLVPVIALLAVLAVWWLLRGDEPGGAMPSSATGAAPVEAADAAALPSTVPERSSPPRTPSPVAERAASSAPGVVAGSAMAVTEYGVGTGVRDRRLVGRSDRFARGTQAWFWTRVEHGKSGDRIEHVWLHDGVEAARIPLSIGGARWRTQSAKTLRSPGTWSVEARDSRGHVLARTEFVCAP